MNTHQINNIDMVSIFRLIIEKGVLEKENTEDAYIEYLKGFFEQYSVVMYETLQNLFKEYLGVFNDDIDRQYNTLPYRFIYALKVSPKMKDDVAFQREIIALVQYIQDVKRLDIEEVEMKFEDECKYVVDYLLDKHIHFNQY